MMNDKINRRTFLNKASCGMGAVAFSHAVTPLMFASSLTSNTGNRKKLLATTDYICDVSSCQCLFTKEHLNQMHKYLSSMGVTRHQWQFYTAEGVYEDNLHGFDIVAEAVKSAHAHGMEFYAVILPFEEGCLNVLPHSLPFPDGAVALKNICGIYPTVTQFIVNHPHMCLKRRPGTYEVNGPVSTIRLVKGDDASTRVRQEHLTLWTSDKNNGFIPYNGPVSFRETVEWRPTFPRGGSQCRILHMEGLKIPADHKYILVRCSIADNQGDFTNERGNIIEMEGPDHGNIPSIISAGPVEYKGLRNSYLQSILSKFNKYIQLPEVQAELLDQKKWDKHFHDYYSFHEDYLSKGKITNLYTLDREGYIAAACGKPEYMLGVLNPTYPEVREYWLDMVRYCLDRGVDGINFRHENHIRSSEYWEYGFNDPVIEAAGGKTDYASIMRINGDAYTQFLIEARDLVKSYGKSIALHLHTHMLFPDDRGYLIGLPPNFEWQWQKWIKEIADEFELRGTPTLRPWNLRQVLDIFSSVTKEANKPFYVQGIVGDGKRPYEFTTQEMNMINNHPGVDGYVLYGTNNYIRINENNELEGSNTFKNLIKTNFF